MAETFDVDWLGCGRECGLWMSAAGTSFGGPEGFVNNNTFLFWWVRQGKVTVSIQGKPYLGTGPKDMFLLRPWQVLKFEYDPLEPSMGSWFRFNLVDIPTDWPEISQWPRKREMPADDIVRPLFEYVVQRTDPADPTNISRDIVLAVKTMMLAYIGGPVERAQMLLRSYPQPVLLVLTWMREFLDSSPRRKVSIDELSEIGGVSSRHLCRLFHEYVGRSPLDLLYTYRVNNSLDGLRSGQKIQSLARECGFAHAGHYASRFKAVFRKSPTQMQKAMKKGYTPKPLNLPFM